MIGLFHSIATNDLAFAYVDPGLMSMVFQSFFTLLFGTVAGWVLVPWKFLGKYLKLMLWMKKPGLSGDTILAKEESNRTTIKKNAEMARAA